jgi:hypothetical protein
MRQRKWRQRYIQRAEDKPQWLRDRMMHVTAAIAVARQGNRKTRRGLSVITCVNGGMNRRNRRPMASPADDRERTGRAWAGAMGFVIEIVR